MVLPDNSHSTLNTKLRLLSVAILCVLFSWKWALPFKVNPQTGLVVVNTIHKLTTKHVSWQKGDETSQHKSRIRIISDRAGGISKL
uniref:Putative secreted protein n=1 Tax=Anopheles darlingi TaxID=43151 RepID=A0A2M4DIS4_ANODA